MLSRIARAIFGPAPSRDDPWAPIIEAAIDKAVEGTDPRLRALPGHRKKLREPVTCAAHFAHELGEGLPGVVAMDNETFSSDPRPRNFFSSPARMQEVFSTSQEVESFLRETGHGRLDRVYAALGMQLSEREVLAPAPSEDGLRNEVRRTLVSFDEHRVVIPAENEARLRRQFKERAFITLVEIALQRMSERREQAEDLEKRRGLLRAKLRALQSGRCGLSALSGNDAPPTDTAALERALEDMERELHEAAASGDVLDRNLQDLCDTLSRPGDFIRMSETGRRITRMSYLAGEGDGEPADTVEFLQVEIEGRPTTSGVLASYPVALLKPREFYRDSMRRALGVTGLPGR